MFILIVGCGRVGSSLARTMLREAAEAMRPGTALYQAVQAQEARKVQADAQFVKAVDPSQVRRG